MSGFVIVAGVLLGLVVGSFLNVVAYRTPLEQSVVSPPSACPHCGHRIRPWDNVPVVSWLLLRGRCRDCGEKISIRYPIVETGTAATFGATAWFIGEQWILIPYLWFAAVTIVLVLTDLDHHRIPNRILYPSTVLGLLLLVGAAFADRAAENLPRALAGGVAYLVLLFIIALVARGGFGMGDVKLAFFLGLFLAYASWGTLVVGIFLAFFVGGLGAIVLLVTHIRGRKDPIAFGPALIAGAWIAIPLGQSLLSWYLGT
ncbi:type 4 prepilin-like proteins leader peptide-processing enzyme [bacterium BMS3Bbin01]|nr:type 4 prepilin-like proteins leader peptide-processing enzyme [bacterium BMS3Bbin01]